MVQSRGSGGRWFDSESLFHYSLALETALKFSTGEINKKNNLLPRVVVKIKRVDLSEALRIECQAQSKCYHNVSLACFICW